MDLMFLWYFLEKWRKIKNFCNVLDFIVSRYVSRGQNRVFKHLNGKSKDIGEERMKKTFFASITIIFSITIACQAEFQVNTNTNDVQEYPAIAIDETGNFVVVWRSKHTGNRGTYGQRFSADGTPIGGEFQTNTTSVGGRVSTGPSVAMDSVGNFVVVWTGYRDEEENIIARRYNSSGSPITGEFVVNTDTHTTFENSHIGPNVAMNSNGSFVIVWEAWHGDDGHNGTWGAYGRAYDSSGNPRGDEFQINQIFHSDTPDVVIDDSGDFVVAWRRQGDSNNPPLSDSIRIRGYNASGTPKGDEVQIAQDNYIYFNGSIKMDGDGNFNLAWSSSPITYRELNSYVQQFTSTGIAISEPFMVNTYTTDSQSRPSIAMNGHGQFMTVWQRENQDGSEYGIYGQEYNNDAMPMGREFRVNTYTLDRQWCPKTALSENGKYVTVWQSNGQDGSGYGIYGEIEEFGTQPPFADFSGDLFVNISDLCILAGEWLKSGRPLQTDLIDDDKIDELDLCALAKQWLTP